MLKTKFIKNSIPTSTPLIELLDHYKAWKETNGLEEDNEEEEELNTKELPDDDSWIFDTIHMSKTSQVEKTNFQTIKGNQSIYSQYDENQWTKAGRLKNDLTNQDFQYDTVGKKQEPLSDIKSIYNPILFKPSNVHQEQLKNEKLGQSSLTGSLKLQSLKISKSEQSQVSPSINWDAMFDTAAEIGKPTLRKETISETEQSTSSSFKKSSMNSEVETSPNIRRYKFNSSDQARISGDPRISWSSDTKKKNSLNDRKSIGSQRQSVDSRFCPKPVDQLYFTLNDDMIDKEYIFRREEFLGFLNSFSEQIEQSEGRR